MSNQVNDEWMERAAEMITYFEGKLPAQVIERDLENHDWESLQVHVKEAEGVAALEEIRAYDVY